MKRSGDASVHRVQSSLIAGVVAPFGGTPRRYRVRAQGGTATASRGIQTCLYIENVSLSAVSTRQTRAVNGFGAKNAPKSALTPL